MHELIIESGRLDRHYWRELWRYRELFFFLAWRDLLVRYKQTVVGVAWGVIRPVLTMVILTVVFGKIAGLPAGGIPYPVLVLCGLLPWQAFSSALSQTGNSLVSNTGLVSKVYFPRLVIPASAIITTFADFLISLGLLALMMGWYHFTGAYRFAPGPAILFLPLFVLLTFATAFGAGLWISALMVRHRDLAIIVPFVVQFGLYISPVGFTSAVATQRFLPEGWRLLYWLNPMAGVIDGFRWSILGSGQTIYWPGIALSCAIVAVVIVGGIRHFRRTERTFADII